MRKLFKILISLVFLIFLDIKANFVAYWTLTSPDQKKTIHMFADLHSIPDGIPEVIKKNFHQYQEELIQFIKKLNAFAIIEDLETYTFIDEGDILLMRYERNRDQIIDRLLQLKIDCNFSPLSGLEYLFLKNGINNYFNVEFRNNPNREYCLKSAISDMSKLDNTTLYAIEYAIDDEIVVVEGLTHCVTVSNNLEKQGYKKSAIILNENIKEERIRNNELNEYLNKLFAEPFIINPKKGTQEYLFNKFLINNPINISELIKEKSFFDQYKKIIAKIFLS